MRIRTSNRLFNGARSGKYYTGNVSIYHRRPGHQLPFWRELMKSRTNITHARNDSTAQPLSSIVVHPISNKLYYPGSLPYEYRTAQ